MREQIKKEQKEKKKKLKLEKLAEQEKLREERERRKALEKRLLEQKKIEEKRKLSEKRQKIEQEKREDLAQKKIEKFKKSKKLNENDTKENSLFKKTSKKKEIDLRALENEKKKQEIIDTKKKTLVTNDKVTQITVISKSDLKSTKIRPNKKEDSILDMKKDVQMVKKNIEEKIKKNELAKKREKEIMARKFSYFKESKNNEENDEDNTKLFYDENVLKKSFLKKDQIIQDLKITDNKKKLPKKNQDNSDFNDTQRNLNGDLVAALSSPRSVMEVKEFKSSEKKETLLFTESEIELGLKQKIRIKEYISLILDKPVKIVIGSSTPKGLKNSPVEKKLQKTRALYLRTFLINQGISHNRISIKIDKKRNISKNWKNELTLIFIGS